MVQCKGIWPVFKHEKYEFFVLDENRVFAMSLGNVAQTLSLVWFDEIGNLCDSKKDSNFIGFYYGSSLPNISQLRDWKRINF